MGQNILTTATTETVRQVMKIDEGVVIRTHEVRRAYLTDYVAAQLAIDTGISVRAWLILVAAFQIDFTSGMVPLPFIEIIS